MRKLLVIVGVLSAFGGLASCSTPNQQPKSLGNMDGGSGDEGETWQQSGQSMESGEEEMGQQSQSEGGW